MSSVLIHSFGELWHVGGMGGQERKGGDGWGNLRKKRAEPSRTQEGKKEKRENKQPTHKSSHPGTPRLSKAPQTPRSHDCPVKRKRKSSLKFLFTHFLSEQMFTEQLLFATDCFSCLRYSSEQRTSSLLSSPELVI